MNKATEILSKVHIKPTETQTGPLSSLLTFNLISESIEINIEDGYIGINVFESTGK